MNPEETTRDDATDALPHNAPGADVVLHEEQLNVGTEWVRTGVVRVRRRVVTFTRTLEVTLRRTELVLDSDDVEFTDSGVGVGTATDDTSTAAREEQAPLVLVLAEEEASVTTTVRPYERVTITVERITDQQDISAEVAAERADVDVPPAPQASSDDR